MKRGGKALLAVGAAMGATACAALLGIDEPLVGDDGGADGGLDGQADGIAGDDAFGDAAEGGPGDDSTIGDGAPDGDSGAGVDAMEGGPPGDGGRDAGGCRPGTQRCGGDAGTSIETCDSTGQWGDVWPCATHACSHGACTGSTGTAPSCAKAGAGLTTCGTTGTTNCCTSLEVAGGAYYRQYTNTGDGGAAESFPAIVSGFRLDEFEVTVGRFAEYAAAFAADAGLPATGSGKHVHLNDGNGLTDSSYTSPYEVGWSTTFNAWVDPTPTNLACGAPYATAALADRNVPINCATWAEAYAFCIWDGGFLPSESEWEYAAAGGAEQREYPWGSAEAGTLDEYAVYGCYYPAGSTVCVDASSIAAVGLTTLGAGGYGQLDLAGNLWEWSLDSRAQYVDPCIDCAYFYDATNVRMIRGGAFNDPPPDLLNSGRQSAAQYYRYNYVGFRCARPP